MNDPDIKITNDAPKNNMYPIGETKVTWTATNATGSTVTCEQTITVRDCEAPLITCPPSMEVCPNADQDYATIPDIGKPTVNDPTAEIISDASTDGMYSIGTTAETWTATDAAGNEASCEQSITVKDPVGCQVTASDVEESGNGATDIKASNKKAPDVEAPEAKASDKKEEQSAV